MPGKAERKKDLTKGKIFRTLFVLAAPIVFGMALNTAFNIVDTFFIGMLGSEQLAAISVTFPVVFIFIAVASGLAIGSTALVSQSIGARKRREASNIASHSMIIGSVSGILIALAGFTFAPPLFQFMGVSGHVLEMTVQYANLIFFGFVFLFVGFIAQGIIQADGDTVTPTRNLAISVTMNIVLDPLLIFGFGPIPAMGLVGAGAATVLSRSVVAFLNIFHILSGRTSVSIRRECFSPDLGILRRIVVIGIPSSISNSINSVGMILLMSFVGVFGTAAIAAFGVGLRLETLAILPVIGLSHAVIPFVGQNLGGGEAHRAEKSVSYASYAVISFMLLFSAVWFFLPEWLFSPFTSDPQVLSVGADYFRIVAFGYVFLGLNFILGSALQAAGRTDYQLLVNAIRWVFTIIIAYALMNIIGINGIWVGFPLGNFIGFLIALAFLKSGLWLRRWREGEMPKPKTPAAVSGQG